MQKAYLITYKNIGIVTTSLTNSAQCYESIPIFGYKITVLVDNEGKAVSLSASVISNEVLSKSITTTSPKLSEVK